MTFSQVQADQSVKDALSGMIASSRVPHAIMFHEDDGGGAVALALAFLQDLFCSRRSTTDSCGSCPSCNKVFKLIHPDIHFIFPVAAPNLSVAYMAKWRSIVLSNPMFTEAELSEALGIEGKSSIIATAEAKAMLETLSLSALEGGYRAVLIYLPEKMNQEAANRLLKMIEEPPALTQFLLVTHSPEKVLKTISSRCQLIRVKPRNLNSRLATAEMLEVYQRLYREMMDALMARDLLEAVEVGEALAALPSRESAKGFCKFAADKMRSIFMASQGMDGLAGADDYDREAAGRCRKTFPRLSIEVLDRTNMLIERNVNLKILFTDMIGKLYKLI